MFKDLSKLEKAGLIIGGLQCIAGFAIAIHSHRKLMKLADEDIQKYEDDNETVTEMVNEKYFEEE